MVSVLPLIVFSFPGPNLFLQAGVVAAFPVLIWAMLLSRAQTSSFYVKTASAPSFKNSPFSIHCSQFRFSDFLSLRTLAKILPRCKNCPPNLKYIIMFFVIFSLETLDFYVNSNQIPQRVCSTSVARLAVQVRSSALASPQSLANVMFVRTTILVGESTEIVR